MLDQNLDISLISSQSIDQVNKCKQLETDTSLEEILDGFSTKESLSPDRSLVQATKARKGRTLVKNPTQQVSWLHLDVVPIISSCDPSKIKQVQFSRKNNKGISSPVIECASTRSSLEMTQNVPETMLKTPSMPSDCLSGSESPDQKIITQERNLLDSNLKINNIRIRRLSNPTGPTFNASTPEKSLLMNLDKPDSVGNSVINSPQSTKAVEKRRSLQFKISSPNQNPISGENLARVLQRSGGSNPGSNTESPRIIDLAEKTDFKFGKRGSFSMFRKLVEAESGKDV